MNNFKERKGVFEFGVSYYRRSIFNDLIPIEFSAGSVLNKKSTNNACEIIIKQSKQETTVYIASEVPETVEFLNNELKKNKRLFWYILAIMAENILITRNESFHRNTCKGFSNLEFIDEYNKALSRLEALRKGKVSDYYYNSMSVNYDALPNYVCEFKDCLLATRFGITEDNEEVSVDDIDTENSDVLAYTHICSDSHMDDERVIRPEMLKRIYETLLVEVNKKHDEGTEYKFSAVLADREVSHFPDYRRGLYNQFKFDPFRPYSITDFDFDELRNIVDVKDAKQYKLSDNIYAFPLDMACKYFKPLKAYSFDCDNYDDKGMFNKLDLLNRIFGDDEEMEERVIDEIKDIPVEKLEIKNSNSSESTKSIISDAERNFINKFEIPLRIIIADKMKDGSKMFVDKTSVGVMINNKVLAEVQLEASEEKECMSPKEFRTLYNYILNFINIAAKPSLVSIYSVNSGLMAKEIVNRLFREDKLEVKGRHFMIDENMVQYCGDIEVDADSSEFDNNVEFMEFLNSKINNGSSHQNNSISDSIDK